MSVVDYNGTSILVMVDSFSNSAENLLTAGAVVLIQSFIPIHFNYEDHADDQCAIIIFEK